jgi:2-C-methyl-D-erythritol 2,4-cyclodiphosphate synthase
MLGGVRVEHDMGLEGHSDADALLHAVIDAILGAASLGDIGEQFPDGDERFRDADSGKLLAQVIQLIGQRGLRVTNCDATVITQGPKLSPYKMAIRRRLALSLGLDIQSVSVKAKTNEGMGWIGRSEGLAALAVVLLEDR